MITLGIECNEDTTKVVMTEYDDIKQNILSSVIVENNPSYLIVKSDEHSDQKVYEYKFSYEEKEVTSDNLKGILETNATDAFHFYFTQIFDKIYRKYLSKFQKKVDCIAFIKDYKFSSKNKFIAKNRFENFFKEYKNKNALFKETQIIYVSRKNALSIYLNHHLKKNEKFSSIQNYISLFLGKSYNESFAFSLNLDGNLPFPPMCFDSSNAYVNQEISFPRIKFSFNIFIEKLLNRILEGHAKLETSYANNLQYSLCYKKLLSDTIKKGFLFNQQDIIRIESIPTLGDIPMDCRITKDVFLSVLKELTTNELNEDFKRIEELILKYKLKDSNYKILCYGDAMEMEELKGFVSAKFGIDNVIFLNEETNTNLFLDSSVCYGASYFPFKTYKIQDDIEFYTQIYNPIEDKMIKERFLENNDILKPLTSFENDEIILVKDYQNLYKLFLNTVLTEKEFDEELDLIFNFNGNNLNLKALLYNKVKTGSTMAIENGIKKEKSIYEYVFNYGDPNFKTIKSRTINHFKAFIGIALKKNKIVPMISMANDTNEFIDLIIENRFFRVE